MLAFVCTDALAPNDAWSCCAPLASRTYVQQSALNTHNSRVVSLPFLLLLLLHFGCEKSRAFSSDKLRLSHPIADRRNARLIPHARLLPPQKSSAQREGTRDCCKSDTREGPHHGSLSRRDSLPSSRALPSFIANPCLIGHLLEHLPKGLQLPDVTFACHEEPRQTLRDPLARVHRKHLGGPRAPSRTALDARVRAWLIVDLEKLPLPTNLVG